MIAKIYHEWKRVGTMTFNLLTHRVLTTYFNFKKLYVWSQSIFMFRVFLRKNSDYF
jgi:hypothetical protein